MSLGVGLNHLHHGTLDPGALVAAGLAVENRRLGSCKRRTQHEAAKYVHKGERDAKPIILEDIETY